MFTDEKLTDLQGRCAVFGGERSGNPLRWEFSGGIATAAGIVSAVDLTPGNDHVAKVHFSAGAFHDFMPSHVRLRDGFCVSWLSGLWLAPANDPSTGFPTATVFCYDESDSPAFNPSRVPEYNVRVQVLKTAHRTLDGLQRLLPELEKIFPCAHMRGLRHGLATGMDRVRQAAALEKLFLPPDTGQATRARHPMEHE